MRDCETIIQKASGEGRSSLLIHEAQQICAIHNIPTPKSRLTQNVHKAIKEAREMGFPVALKIVSPQIIHKSDVGGVILDIKNEHELENQYKKMYTEVPQREPNAQMLGNLVTKMI